MNTSNKKDMKLANACSYLIAVIAIIILSSCSQEDSFKGSALDTSTPKLSVLDTYIRTNYVSAYNIDVLYKWNENVVDNNRFLFPPVETNVQPVLEVVEKIWLDSYSEVGGTDFVKLVAPRQLLLVGGRNYNQSGTILLGLAEGGKRITLFETDLVDVSDKANITRFLSTIQHEYCHILNQTIPFDEDGYGEITPAEYTAQWFNTSIADARELGFISDYARSNVIEDFAEMVNFMLINSNEEYNALIDAIVDVEARENIRKKEVIVADYFDKQWDIDIYELQEVTARNTQEVINN
ncbi:substrate import-associated zinc metallohydrolase lipoprotein [Cellulophaga sp. L1A9]|uniref:substrate import-associated zinc metallohydrolase lipoprotein n=1 Tax=Cellulophaga sp. L1A9 TaxID=2686362 RepID=UPI00131DBF36|nr:substrate import-associated zinc metallohydrolase lipoprotein [Cellulophaga sp. L1A9]